MANFSISGTPNPNSVKITTEDGPFINDGLVAFNSPAEAQGHQLGEALFSNEGIENVLITPAFVTVTKSDRTTWDQLMPSVKQTLSSHLEQLHG